MKIQIHSGQVVAWGEMPDAFGDDIFEQGVPADFSLDKYTYTPNEDGSFNPDGFTPILADENGNPL